MRIQNFIIKAKLNKIFTVNITCDLNTITKNNPGNYGLESFDSDFLIVKKCDWFRNINTYPSLNIQMLPIKTGNTQVIGFVQLCELTPLYIKIIYNITID